MKDTYIARFMGCNQSNMSQGNLWSAVFGIQNSSDYDVEILRIYTESMSGWDATQTTNPISIWVTSADTSGETVTPLKHDTNATLPTQVTTKKHSSITTTSLFNHPGQGIGMRTNGNAIWSGRHGFAPPWNLLHGTYRSGGFVQPKVLREGQGIAVVNDSPNIRPRSQYVHIMFRNQSTGDTYTASAYNVPAGERDVMLSLFNGTGSGVILEVMRIESFDYGAGFVNTSDSTSDGNIASNQVGQSSPSFRLALVADLTDGELVVPASMDTANVLPSGISFFRGGYAIPLPGSSANQTHDLLQEATLLVDVTPFLSIQRQGILRLVQSHVLEGWQAGSANFPHRWKTGAMRDLFRRPNLDGAGYTVKKGTCLALLWWARFNTPGSMQSSPFTISGGQPWSGDENASTLSNFNINVEFAVSIGGGTPIIGVPIVSGSFIS